MKLSEMKEMARAKLSEELQTKADKQTFLLSEILIELRVMNATMEQGRMKLQKQQDNARLKMDELKVFFPPEARGLFDCMKI